MIIPSIIIKSIRNGVKWSLNCKLTAAQSFRRLFRPVEMSTLDRIDGEVIDRKAGSRVDKLGGSIAAASIHISHIYHGQYSSSGMELRSWDHLDAYNLEILCNRGYLYPAQGIQHSLPGPKRLASLITYISLTTRFPQSAIQLTRNSQSRSSRLIR